MKTTENQATQSSRGHSKNQVCSGIELSDTAATGHLIVDQSHPFFFDHPLDHVPGLLLIEAMHQLAERVACQRQPGRGALTATGIEVTFSKFCVFGDEAMVTAQAAPGAGTRVVAMVEQAGILRCRGTFAFQPCTPVAAFPAVAAHAPVQACSKELVGKSGEANVMIDAPRREGNTLIHQVLQPHPDNILADDRFGRLPVLYVLEAFMQTQRYLNKMFQKENGNRRMRDTLCGVSIRMTRAVARGEELRIERMLSGEEQPRTGMRSQRGAVYSQDECIGECRINTLTIV